MFSKAFTDVGIPPGYGFKQLLFSPIAKALVVQVESVGPSWRPERLYYRHNDSEKYQLLGDPHYLSSQESPFIHQSKPLLAYNSLRHNFSVNSEGEERHSGDWDALKIFDLERGVEAHSIDRETLKLPASVTRGWICEVVAYGDSGLFVKVGLSKNSVSMEYFVAELDVMQNTLAPIVVLPAAFM
jgi:hypothetical protein